MQELFPQATGEAADRSDWLSLTQTGSRPSVTYLSDPFYKAAREATTKGDTTNSEVYGLIAHLVSMMYQPDNRETPYAAMWQTSTGRSGIVSDFTEQNLDFFKHLIGKSNLPSLDARLADVLWLRRKDRADAELALESYLAHAKLLLRIGTDNWLYGKESLERAAQLWKQLGRPEKYSADLISLAEDSVSPEASEPNDYYRVFLLEVMGEYGLFKEADKWVEAANQLAVTAKAGNHFEKARKYWECAARFTAYLKDKKKQQQSIADISTDSFVEEARSLRAAGASAMIVAEKFSQAIEACRRAGNRRQLIDELHQEMNEVQEKVLGELKKTEVSIDVTKLVESGRKAVDDVPLNEAIANIARIAAPQKKAQLRASVEKASKEFVFMSLVSAVNFNDKGRVVARPEPALSNDEETRQAGILAQMIIQCGQAQQLTSMSQIEAAREVLERRMPSDSREFEELVTMNPFVPQGREEIFLRGLKAGLVGDWMNCAHLLIPQIENSVRTAMERSGLLVTRLTTDHIQKELDLNTLLYETETEKVFGEDMVFSMRTLLVEEVGGNYRNRLAHGLLESNHFHAGWVNYLWAMTIRLCWLGKLIQAKAMEEQSKSEKE